MINFTINGQPVIANKGETILQAARKAGFYIPTMCYLEKTTPCASCRLCVVETDKTDGLILSCQTPPTEGLGVTINSERLEQERTNIMRLYDVNHPLECGVCDKSGACDLQNKTLEFGVSAQHFSAKDQHRAIEHWGMINYDPALCILCEKCVHVCNEIIGDDAITLQFGGYKSAVIPKNSEVLDCTFCGECIAVCPVGALVSSDFQYTANAWELSQIPATCVHCSAGCSLTYEVKHTSTTNANDRIYRVTNNFEHMTLCGAGRFGFDFDQQSEKNEAEFTKAVEAIRNASAIRFSALITNEEAMILQQFKKMLGIKLYNEEARAYQSFMAAYASVSGKMGFGGSLDAIKQSDGIIVVGGRITTDNPVVRYAMTSAARHNGAKVVYMHPLEDTLLQNVVTQFVKYEVGTEEGVIAMLASTLLQDADINDEMRKFFADLDEGYLCAESNVGDEEFIRIAKSMGRAKRKTLIIGSDVLNHKRAANIARLCAMIETYTEFSVVVVAPSVNTIGVSLICDLDADNGGDGVVGYNAAGEYTMGSIGDVMLKLPSLNSQEGTFVSINHQVLPTNVAVAFYGYTLNDLANALGLKSANTIDYTAQLPVAKGFNGSSFDDLGNFYGPLGEDDRGYILENIDVEIGGSLEEIEDLPEFNGTVVYRCNPVNQFNAYTARTSQLEKEATLSGSAQFAAAAKITDGDKIQIVFAGEMQERIFKLDASLKGTIALVPAYDVAYGAMNEKYRFEKVKIMRMGNES
ncbi:MAG: 2Fe-2S iron-sulfur cluster-binding protein [Sulfuricurvum sp.]|uniref:2Fe-2S iron-sulfur cluster-binding protein n=1 Tax=Sulfuricurvum sp. TaxID=2025608 RepID=UPI002612199A|nr:2Fe-2S iron-sulfur cluster-binding protein [Sulfuricurvum sp.]MDD2949681.1 2Fe-2S iron-sulfur cluster-binding protein [Sulfuricurvum sp.]MDD5118215.1 2Fe-2S iron-sulfur cluster-binding protein [Sulfuricurvum sp.]